MNGKLVSQNPRYLLKNDYSSELIIKTIHPLDQGLYECRTDQIVNAIIQLNVVHCQCNFCLLTFGGRISKGFFSLSVQYPFDCAGKLQSHAAMYEQRHVDH